MQAPFPKLETTRLRLRQMRDSDLEHIFAALSHPDVIRYYGVQFSTLESTREQMRWYADIYQSGTGIWWAVCPREGDDLYGAIGFNNISHKNKKGEIGFWLLPERWGNGYVSEVLPVVLEYAYETLGLHRIEAFVEQGNVPSARVLLKFGFTHEGTMRDCEVKDGGFISLDVYARLVSDG